MSITKGVLDHVGDLVDNAKRLQKEVADLHDSTRNRIALGLSQNPTKAELCLSRGREILDNGCRKLFQFADSVVSNAIELDVAADTDLPSTELHDDFVVNSEALEKLSRIITSTAYRITEAAKEYV